MMMRKRLTTKEINRSYENAKLIGTYAKALQTLYYSWSSYTDDETTREAKTILVDRIFRLIAAIDNEREDTIEITDEID